MHVSRTPDEQERTIAESGKIESERFPASLFRVTDTAARQAASAGLQASCSAARAAGSPAASRGCTAV